MGEGEDITKEQLKKEIQDILKDADLDNTSAKKVIPGESFPVDNFKEHRAQ